MARPTRLKIYKIRINHRVLSENWYHSHKTKEFNAVLITKEGVMCLNAAFLVVEELDGELMFPTFIRTVKPEDCTVVWEENVVVSGCFFESVKRIKKKDEFALQK